MALSIHKLWINHITYGVNYSISVLGKMKPKDENHLMLLQATHAGGPELGDQISPYNHIFSTLKKIVSCFKLHIQSIYKYIDLNNL